MFISVSGTEWLERKSATLCSLSRRTCSCSVSVASRGSVGADTVIGFPMLGGSGRLAAMESSTILVSESCWLMTVAVSAKKIWMESLRCCAVVLSELISSRRTSHALHTCMTRTHLPMCIPVAGLEFNLFILAFLQILYKVTKKNTNSCKRGM